MLHQPLFTLVGVTVFGVEVLDATGFGVTGYGLYGFLTIFFLPLLRQVCGVLVCVTFFLWVIWYVVT